MPSKLDILSRANHALAEDLYSSALKLYRESCETTVPEDRPDIKAAHRTILHELAEAMVAGKRKLS